MRANRILSHRQAPTIETLAEYVARVLKDKNLKHREVEQLSGGTITEGYVRGIMTGKAKNPSIAKLKALARGLGVSEQEVFNVARGAGEGDTETHDSQSHYWVIVNLMAASLKNRSLIELLSEVAKLPHESHDEAVRTLKYLNDRRSRPSHSKNV